MSPLLCPARPRSGLHRVPTFRLSSLCELPPQTRVSAFPNRQQYTCLPTHLRCCTSKRLTLLPDTPSQTVRANWPSALTLLCEVGKKYFGFVLARFFDVRLDQCSLSSEYGGPGRLGADWRRVLVTLGKLWTNLGGFDAALLDGYEPASAPRFHIN